MGEPFELIRIFKTRVIQTIFKVKMHKQKMQALLNVDRGMRMSHTPVEIWQPNFLPYDNDLKKLSLLVIPT